MKSNWLVFVHILVSVFNLLLLLEYHSQSAWTDLWVKRVFSEVLRLFRFASKFHSKATPERTWHYDYRYEQLTACGHSEMVTWGGIPTAAGQAAHSSGLLDTESSLEKRSPTSSPQMTTGKTPEENQRQCVEQNIEGPGQHPSPVWEEEFSSNTNTNFCWTYDISLGGVDRVRQTLHGHPLDWDAASYFLAVVVVAIDFLGQAKVSDTNPQVIAEPVENS